MNEKDVRDIFALCWKESEPDEVFVAAQMAICNQILIETVAQTKINLDEAGVRMFLGMASAISRLSHFHGLHTNTRNDIPASYGKHLGFIVAAYKDAARYCYENYGKIAHYNFICGRPRKEIQKLSDAAEKRVREIEAEIARTNEVSFDVEEFKALHELFCFIIQTILGGEAFSKYIKEVNKTLVYLRTCQSQLVNVPDARNQKPS